MRCFVHLNKEAIAACRTCGKGMCADCSAYSGHSGVCPQCRKAEFEKEVQSLNQQNRELSGEIFWSVLLAILLCWTIIGLIWNIVAVIIKANQKNSNATRISTLKEEIARLDKILINRGTNMFR